MATFLEEAIPIAVFAEPGTIVSLENVLTQAFGNALPYKDTWIAYYGADYLQANNFSYWNPSTPYVARWTINGGDIGSGFNHQTYVAGSNLSTVSIVAGNSIVPNLYLTVRIDDGTGNPVYIQYNVSVVSTQFQPFMAAGRAPTANEIVAMATKYVAAYGGTLNPNDCHSIDFAIGAAAGATLREHSWSLNPAQNFDGGFWRVVHRGSDNPVPNWLDLTQPGDIVRFDWSDPNAAQHTTMVVGTVGANGRVDVVDNGGGSIGLHHTDYDNISVASSVTIYRLATDNLYVTETTDQSETYAGTLYNDDIRSRGGNDTVRSGAGNDRVNLGAGSDTLDGGTGSDTAIFTGDRGEYDIRTALVAGLLQTRVVHLGGGGADGSDILNNVEALAFAGHTFGFAGAQLNHISNVAGTRFDDVLFQNAANGQVLYASMWGGGFNGWGTATGALGAGWQAVASGDVNPGATGGAETFVQNTANGTIYYASRDTGAVTWGVVSTSLTADWKLRAVADLNGDASADAVVQNQTNGTTYYANMRGGAFQGWYVVNQNLTGDWKAVGAGDLNGDGFADVVVQSASTGTTYYANMANGAFAGWGTVSTNLAADWNVKAVADLTGDGFADVIFQQASSGTTYYADMKNGVLDHWGVVTTSVTGDWAVEGVADVDNDGFADVLFQNAASGTTYYAEVNGGGTNVPAWGVVASSITNAWHVV